MRNVFCPFKTIESFFLLSSSFQLVAAAAIDDAAIALIFLLFFVVKAPPRKKQSGGPVVVSQIAQSGARQKERHGVREPSRKLEAWQKEGGVVCIPHMRCTRARSAVYYIIRPSCEARRFWTTAVVYRHTLQHYFFFLTFFTFFTFFFSIQMLLAVRPSINVSFFGVEGWQA